MIFSFTMQKGGVSVRGVAELILPVPAGIWELQSAGKGLGSKVQ